MQRQRALRFAKAAKHLGERMSWRAGLLLPTHLQVDELGECSTRTSSGCRRDETIAGVTARKKIILPRPGRAMRVGYRERERGPGIGEIACGDLAALQGRILLVDAGRERKRASPFYLRLDLSLTKSFVQRKRPHDGLPRYVSFEASPSRSPLCERIIVVSGFPRCRLASTGQPRRIRHTRNRERDVPVSWTISSIAADFHNGGW